MEFLPSLRLCEKTIAMKEDFLHYIWRLQRFDRQYLQTTQGEVIQLISIGEHNVHAGPDFLNARIRLGNTLWAGNIEIHLKSSEWLTHHHQQDPAYANVILHVVLEEDQIIHHPNGERIPCLELKKRIAPRLSKEYLRLVHQAAWIPCQKQIHQVSEITKSLWLDRLLVERLEEKTKLIQEALLQTNHNWEEAFYRMLARSYGLKVNPEPFEQLARSLPLNILRKHKNQLMQIEALFFGQAGMLNENFSDPYPNKLKREYEFLQKKYKLRALPKVNWKFLRLRPANFPTIRIAQLAMLIFQSSHLFSKVLAAKNTKEIEQMFDRRISPYWVNHYVFDKVSKKRKKTLGKNTIHLFIINTISPFLFYYGHQQGEEKHKDKALSLLEELKPEQNSIIQQWKKLGLTPTSAYQSQALLQLKKNYCDEKRCMDCAIGHSILNFKKDPIAKNR